MIKLARKTMLTPDIVSNMRKITMVDDDGHANNSRSRRTQNPKTFKVP